VEKSSTTISWVAARWYAFDMCGRYYRRGDKQKIAEAFHAKLVEDSTPLAAVGLQRSAHDYPAHHSQ
jgi:hypothetical protein